jgi:hypothetical protein
VDHRTLETQRSDAIKKGDFQKAQELDRPAEEHLGHNIIRNTAKQARKYIRSARTPEELERKRDEYYQKVERNEKARKVHDIREYRRMVQAIEKEKERIPENSLYRYDFQLKEINLRLNRLLSERQKLSQNVLTPERAEWIAQSVYLKKLSLNESQPKLGTPEADAQIEKIKAAVLKKNEPYREQLENLDSEIQNLRNERDEVKQERAAKREEIKAEKRMIVGPERYKTQDAYEKLNRSVNELNRKTENRGALTARILVEDDREKDMER